MTASTWTLKGTLMIACNCDYGCPCNVNGRPTTGKCEGGWTWHIESGSYGRGPRRVELLDLRRLARGDS